MSSTRTPSNLRELLRQARAWRPSRRTAVLASVFTIAMSVAFAAEVVLSTPGPDRIRTMGDVPVATRVFDRHDDPAFTIFEEQRIDVPLDRISTNVVQAVLAIEDQRFYRHSGLDVWRIGGAALANVQAGGRAQGGSTITQQLARQSFLTSAKTVRRKLQEAVLAVRIERLYSKDQILEMYLNKVYLGDGFYGVEAAARGYFGKPAAELDVAEAALIAGLIQAPSAYSPTQHLERAVARRAVVLRQMAEAGVIDAATADELARSPVRLVNRLGNGAVGPYVRQAVTQELVARFGWELVSTGGLRVFTTIDPEVQTAAETALTEGLDAVERHRGYRHPTRAETPAAVDGRAPDYLQGALVALDPRTGEIRALVGGRDFSDSPFDRTSQARRQAGSAFKPFVYAAALEMGYTPATMVTNLDDPIDTPDGAWIPEDGHAGASAMTVRAALRTSSNRAAVQVLRQVGISEAVEYANRLGVGAPPVPSLVLGSGDVTLLAMTAAYGVFADGGRLHTPFLIRRVEDTDGAVLFEEPAPTGEQVVSEDTAFLMSQMLADVVDHGTGYRVRQAGFRLPAAGKTGTTNDYRDAWFVGYTPDLVAGVWVGFDRPKTIMQNGYASELAAPIWARFMRGATADEPARWIDQPDDVVAVPICRVTGLRPGSGCSRVATLTPGGDVSWGSAIGVEYFRRGTEPQEECPIHRASAFPGAVRAVLEPPESVSLAGLPMSAADVRAGAIPAAISAPEPEPRKKKGFWSRLAGVFKRGG